MVQLSKSAGDPAPASSTAGAARVPDLRVLAGGAAPCARAAALFSHIACLANAAAAVSAQASASGDPSGWLGFAAESLMLQAGWAADRGSESLGDEATSRPGAQEWLLPPTCRVAGEEAGHE